MKKKNQGQLLMLAGILMIVINALTYLLTNSDQIIVGTLGLLFLIIGINISKRK